ncbi:3-isopropylmalate dehydratase small subunit [Nocardia sp. NPDC005998]|uniref:3-isopropylmalate dehydratase small subunit n=1 Tax=Nocardia sp. NPDC005998 TaxID=3156894 RepID=UPI0033A078CA
MQPFLRCTGIAVPLRRSNVDTDQILPSEFMKRTTCTGYEDALFAEWRKDPGFILNHTPFDRGRIHVAGPDFGIGSSREHAVWALLDYGFRAVLSSRFADIFRTNAGKAGLLCAQLATTDIEALWHSIDLAPQVPLTVDLATQEVTVGNNTHAFDIDNSTKWRLLRGLDDIDLTLGHADAITEFERHRPRWNPRTT